MQRRSPLRDDSGKPEVLEALLSRVLACFDRPGVVAVYLFGSAARGGAHALSDVDLAYVAADPAVEDRLFDEIYESLQREMGEGGFDLASLRQAPLHLRFDVVTEGRMLLCRDPIASEDFAAETIMRYLDFKPYRDRYFGRGD